MTNTPARTNNRQRPTTMAAVRARARKRSSGLLDPDGGSKLRGESGELLPLHPLSIPHKFRAATLSAQKTELINDRARSESDSLWRHECEMWGVDEESEEESAVAPSIRSLSDFDTTGVLNGPSDPYAAISLAATHNDPTLLAALSAEQLSSFVEATATVEQPSELEQLSLALCLSVLCDAPAASAP